MDLLLNVFKGQFTSLNFLLLLFLLAAVLHKMKYGRCSRVLFLSAVLFFIITSTGFLPRYLVNNIESNYPPFTEAGYHADHDTIYIHALGGGYISDPRLEATGQLSQVSLGRLTEALRIAHLYDKSILVLSGPAISGKRSIAWVEKRAAVLLGFDSARIFMLEDPATTQEEAYAFVKKFGRAAPPILVTDAIHMSRAVRFFNEQGIDPFPAPTNYLVKNDDNSVYLEWIPSVENFQLMDRVYREWLGSLKGYIIGSV